MSYKILIVDFASQFTWIIARKIREIGIYCKVISYSTISEQMVLEKVKAIIMSGGGNSINHSKFSLLPNWIYKLDIPILGICYGQQLIIKHFGGKIIPTSEKNYGASKLFLFKESSLFQAYWSEKKYYNTWSSYTDTSSNLPNNFNVVAGTELTSCAAIGSLLQLW